MSSFVIVSAIIGVMVVLVVSNLVPVVVTMEQAYRAINCNAGIMVAASLALWFLLVATFLVPVLWVS